MSNVPAQQQRLSPEQQLSRWLQDRGTLDRIDDLLCGVMSAEAYIGSILLALNDPKLAKCTVESKYSAAFKCATMGFIPNLSHVALHSSNNKKLIDGKEVWVNEVRVTPQWQGYKAIMERHPEILEVQAVIVFSHEDLLTQNGGIVIHTYDPLDERRVVNSSPSMDNIRGGYTKVTYRDRTRPPKYHFTTIDHIRKSRKCAETDKLWQAWTDRMVLKTLYRDAWSNRVTPIDPIHAKQMQAVLEHDDSELGNDPSRIAAQQQPAIEAPRQRSRGQALLDNLPQAQEFVIEQPQTTLEPVEPTKEKPKAKEKTQSSAVPAHEKFADLQRALNECSTSDEVDAIMVDLPNYLDDLSRPATDEANRMAVARKQAIG